MSSSSSSSSDDSFLNEKNKESSSDSDSGSGSDSDSNDSTSHSHSGSDSDSSSNDDSSDSDDSEQDTPPLKPFSAPKIPGLSLKTPAINIPSLSIPTSTPQNTPTEPEMILSSDEQSFVSSINTSVNVMIVLPGWVSPSSRVNDIFSSAPFPLLSPSPNQIVHLNPSEKNTVGFCFPESQLSLQRIAESSERCTRLQEQLDHSARSLVVLSSQMIQLESQITSQQSKIIELTVELNEQQQQHQQQLQQQNQLKNENHSPSPSPSSSSTSSVTSNSASNPANSSAASSASPNPTTCCSSTCSSKKSPPTWFWLALLGIATAIAWKYISATQS